MRYLSILLISSLFLINCSSERTTDHQVPAEENVSNAPSTTSQNSGNQTESELQKTPSVKLYFATWVTTDALGKQVKTDSREVPNFFQNKEHTYCYDSEIFDQLIVDGFGSHVTLTISKDGEVVYKKENISASEATVLKTEDVTFEMGHTYSLKIQRGQDVLFEGTIKSEGCM